MSQDSRLLDAAFSIAVWLVITVLTVAYSLLVIAAALVSRPFDRRLRAPHVMCALWARSIVWCVPAWKLTITGRTHLDPRRTYLLVANHQSMFDIMAGLCLGRQFKFVAKHSLFAVPFLGWAMHAAGYVHLMRGEQASIRRTYHEVKRWLAAGMSVWFFPEGTRSVTGELGAFKNGAFKLAIQAGVPVVPIAIHGTHDLLHKHSWIANRRARVHVTVLEPIDVTAYSRGEFDRLRDDTHRRIAAALR